MSLFKKIKRLMDSKDELYEPSAPQVADNKNNQIEAETASQNQYLEACNTRLQATPEESPDLLGINLKEGKV